MNARPMNTRLARAGLTKLNLILAVMTLAIFMIDQSLPDGKAISVLFNFVVILSSRTDHPKHILVWSAICVLLTSVGYPLRHGFLFSYPYFARRLLCDVSLLVMAGLSLRHQFLQRVRREYAALLDTAATATIVRDGTGIILSWSRGAERLYGWSASQAEGQRVDDLLGAEERPSLDRAHAALLQAGRWKGELHRRTAAGQKRTVLCEWVLQRSKSGAIGSILESNVDVTEHKRAEELIRRREAHYHGIFEMAGAAIWQEDHEALERTVQRLKTAGVTDFADYFHEHHDDALRCLEDARVTDVNHAAVKLMLAHGKDKLKNCNGSIILRCGRDIFAECLATAVEGGRVYETETVLTNLHGEWRNVLLCVTFSHGTEFFRNVFISIMDITERKNAEEALLHVRGELARVTRSATLGELTSMVAYEVERPLDAIFENSRQAAQRLQNNTGCDAITAELVERVISDARHAAEVVDGVRKFLRESSGEAGSFALSAALASTMRLLGSTLLTHEITLHTDIAPGLPEVAGESNWLEHVLVYLLLKAVQALAKRHKRDRALYLAAWFADAEIVIRISSKTGGAVLPPEDTPITHDIGMSVCRTSVEAQGGRILVTRDTGVSVIFPPEKPLI